MADQKRVVRIGLYIEGKLCTEMESGKYGHQTGDEQAHGFDGANYFSDGNDTTTVDFTTIVPKLGHADTTMRTVMINKTPIMLTLTLEGGIEQVKGRFTSRDYDTDSKSGMTKCSWKFVGGKPEIIG